MTTPGGVPNLPHGALTIETLAGSLQDMTPAAMRGRAADRMPAIFGGSSGGSPLSDLSPFGVIMNLFSHFNSLVANADPADIQGPEDLPGLLLSFIEDLPVVGQFIDILQAILGSYEGDDPTLLAIERVFNLIRNLFGGIDFTNPSLDPADVWQTVINTLLLPLNLLLGPNSPLNLANAFGSLGQWALPPINIGRLTSDPPNLVADGWFDAASSGDPTSRWFRDPAKGHSNPGAARVIGDGLATELMGTPFSVASGQKYRVGAWVAWDSATGSAGSLQLQIHEFLGQTQVSTQVVASATPSGTAGFSEIFATYTVPSGVDTILVAPAVTAGFTSGTAWYDDVTGSSTGQLQMGWTAGLSDLNIQSNQIRDILAGLVVTPVNSVVQDIKDWFTGIAGKTQNLTDGGLFDASKLNGAVGESNAPFVGDLRDTIKNAIDKIAGSGWSLSTVAESLGGLSDSVAAQAAALAALQDQAEADSNSGVTGLETFEYVNTSSLDTSLWDTEFLEGSSSLAYLAVADGHNAGMVHVANGSVTQFGRFNGINHTTLTDYQESKVVVAERMTAPSWGGLGTPPATDVYCRMNSSRTQWVRARFVADGTCTFQYRNGGSVTNVGSTTSISNPSVGATLAIRAGTTGGIRVYQAVINGAVVNSWTDSSSVTAVGSSNRDGGFGQRQQDNNRPGKVAYYSLTDNAPVAVVGTTMRVYRTSTSTISKSSGDQPLASGTFDTIDYITPDLSWSSTTNEVTVSKAGTYLCAVRLETNTRLGMGGERWYPFWSVGGSKKADGMHVDSVSTNGFGVPATSGATGVGGDPFVYYVPAGGVIRPGMGSIASLNLVGNAGGTLTWMTVTKIG